MDFLTDWWFIAMLSSFFGALYTTMNGRYKVAGNTLVFGRSAMIMLLMFPFMFLIGWPESPLFWALSLGAGFFAAYGDIVRFNVVAQYGGSAVSRINPMKIWIVFAIWVMVSPSSFLPLWDDPMRLLGILAMLALGSISLTSLNRCPVSNQVLFAFLPAVLFQSCSDVLFKGGMEHHVTGGLTAALQFIFIASIVMTVVGLFDLTRKRKPLKQDKKTLYVSALGAALFFAITFLTAFAFRDAPNPSYVVALYSLNVVWIYLYHRFMGIPDNSNVRAGIFFVLSTVGLVLLTK